MIERSRAPLHGLFGRLERVAIPPASEVDPSALELPFDVYQRYRLVADLVRLLASRRRRAAAKSDGNGRNGHNGARNGLHDGGAHASVRIVEPRPLSVLDVGGGTGVLRRFLPEHKVALVDIEPQGTPDCVTGSGAALPFADGAFDLVVSADTLEHVRADQRRAFLSECARCARSAVIVAAPFRDERVMEAEETLRGFLRAKLGFEHRYLDEHRDLGLPRRAEVEAALAGEGARVTSIGHGNLERWLALLCTSMYMERDPHLARVARSFYRFYNQALYHSDHVGPVYRHAVVAVFDDAPLPLPAELFGPPTSARAPEGSLEPFVALAAELFAFDRERDVYDAERARLERVIGGLQQDLAGHAAHAATLAADLAGQRGHAATLAAQTATLAAEVDARGAHTSELVSELARVLSEAAAERERAARERDAERAARETLLRDLDGHRAVVLELRREVERENGEARALAQRLNELDHVANELHEQVVADRIEIESLRAQLRSRWKSLARVFRR